MLLQLRQNEWPPPLSAQWSDGAQKIPPASIDSAWPSVEWGRAGNPPSRASAVEGGAPFKVMPPTVKAPFQSMSGGVRVPRFFHSCGRNFRPRFRLRRERGPKISSNSRGRWPEPSPPGIMTGPWSAPFLSRTAAFFQFIPSRVSAPCSFNSGTMNGCPQFHPSGVTGLGKFLPPRLTQLRPQSSGGVLVIRRPAPAP